MVSYDLRKHVESSIETRPLREPHSGSLARTGGRPPVVIAKNYHLLVRYEMHLNYKVSVAACQEAVNAAQMHTAAAREQMLEWLRLGGCAPSGAR